MFIPNNQARVKAPGGFNKFGEPTFGPVRTVPCAVIALNRTTEKTSVRTDSSATRGNAEELAASAKILFKPGIAGQGMKVEIAGFELRIIDVQPRYAVTGAHDHDECLLSIWQEGSP